MNHFEFTGETKVFLGITLKRIKASISFGTIIKGEIGGWIEKEENLPGNAWVSGDAQVYGNARVYGNAQVSGNARVYGDAWKKSPLHIMLTRWPLTVSSKTIITIGCNSLTLQQWNEQSDCIIKKEKMSKEEITEYKLAIEYAKQWMAIYCKKED